MLLNDSTPFRYHWPKTVDLRINNMAYRPYSRNSTAKLGANGRDQVQGALTNLNSLLADTDTNLNALSAGIGLSLVKGFAEAQGGSVRAENRAAGGALFTVKLPRAKLPPIPEEKE